MKIWVKPKIIWFGKNNGIQFVEKNIMVDLVKHLSEVNKNCTSRPVVILCKKYIIGNSAAWLIQSQSRYLLLKKLLRKPNKFAEQKYLYFEKDIFLLFIKFCTILLFWKQCCTHFLVLVFFILVKLWMFELRNKHSKIISNLCAFYLDNQVSRLMTPYVYYIAIAILSTLIAIWLFHQIVQH